MGRRRRGRARGIVRLRFNEKFVYNRRARCGPRYISHPVYAYTVKCAFNIRLESVVQTKRLSSNAGNEKLLQVAQTDDAIIRHVPKCMRAQTF